MTEPIRGIVVSVGYDDLLAVTLPRAARHLEEVLVVTHPDDEATKAVAKTVPNARTYETDAFFRHGAAFNKGYAMELAFDALGRWGWILILDADVVLPDAVAWPENLDPCDLYGARRRVLEDVREWREDLDWGRFPARAESSTWGYFQLFHAGCPYLRGRPWYAVDYVHAAGCDADFQTKWPPQRRLRVGFDVLHLGPLCTNWFGRASERVDGKPVGGWRERLAAMDSYCAARNWSSPRPLPRTDGRPFVEPRITIPKEEYPL